MARQPTAAEIAKNAEANAKARELDPGMEALLARGRAKRAPKAAQTSGWVGSGPHSAPQAAAPAPSGTVEPVTDAKTTVTPAKPAARGTRAR